MFMVMDSHLKETENSKKHQNSNDRQASCATLNWSFKIERTQPRLHARLSGVGERNTPT